MNRRLTGKTQALTESVRQLAIIGGLFLGACLLGAAVIAVGVGSNLNVPAVGAAVFLVIGGVVWLILGLPAITVVRFVFIASFFFKADINFYKIDELEDPSGFNLSLTLLTALILLIYDQFDCRENIKEKVFPNSFSFVLAALFICGGISVLYASATELAWFALWSFLTSILIAYVVASHFSQRERLVQLVIGLAIGLLFTGVVALSQYTIDFPTELPSFGTGTEEELLGTQSKALSRVQAFLRTPTELAWVVSTLIPLVIAPVICRVKSFTSRQKFILLTGAFSGTIAVILSLARGSWISLVAAVLLVILFGWYRLSAKERKNYFASVAGTIILICVLLTPFAGRIYDRLNEDDMRSILIRIPLMENALRIIEDNPLVGIGLNGYRTHMTRYDETGVFVSQVFPNPVHNIFAHITAEIGIPGGIIFGLLILVVLFECLKMLTVRDRLLFALTLGAVAGIIAFIISGVKEPSSLGSIRPPMRTLFFLFGMVLAISRIRRQFIL